MSDLHPSPQRVRLFENNYLEKLTLISPFAFATVWGFALPLVFWVGWGAVGPLAGLGLFSAGLITWTLFEYAMHRYLFHLQLDFPVARWFVFLIHGNHHDDPGDRMRSLMPFSVSVPILALIWAGCYTSMGPGGTWAFLGFFAGYVAYDSIHYATHHLPMRGRVGAALKRHHMRHHHINEDANFAISAIFWDRVFGTGITSLRR